MQNSSPANIIVNFNVYVNWWLSYVTDQGGKVQLFFSECVLGRVLFWFCQGLKYFISQIKLAKYNSRCAIP